MYKSITSIIFISIFLISSCGQTPKERIEAERKYRDSVEQAEEKMIEIERKAALRLDSIRDVAP